jgi:CRP/FNR family cyclic AMP-dependent transcriptional regulator
MSTTTERLETFFKHYTSLKYEKNERILRENENPSGVFYLSKGIIRLYLISDEGNELTVIMQPEGTVFPLRWALDGQTNIYNFQAMTPVEVWRAPREAFLTFLKDTPEVTMGLLDQQMFDFGALVYRMQHIVFGNAHAKVASIVLTAAKRFGEKMENEAILVQVPLTHQQIADSAGITRETASLEMKKLKDTGIITYKGRTIIINDITELGKVSYL